MNSEIAVYFDAIEARLISSPAVISYRILRREITPTDGKIRIKAELNDGERAEFFEYVVETSGQIGIRKYSFHWQDKRGNLIKRWDNAPHHKEFTTRHHVHLADGTVSEMTQPTAIHQAILEIEIELINKGK